MRVIDELGVFAIVNYKAFTARFRRSTLHFWTCLLKTRAVLFKACCGLIFCKFGSAVSSSASLVPCSSRPHYRCQPSQVSLASSWRIHQAGPGMADGVPQPESLATDVGGQSAY